MRNAWKRSTASGEGYVNELETVRFSGGAFDGEQGELLIDPLAIPHIWTATRDLVLTVSGDLTRSELVRVAESLERQ